jgi:hypothetical protein
MRKAILVTLALAIAVPAIATEGADVAYTGGTLSQLNQGAIGKFDLTSGSELLFVYPGGKLEIPYDRIEFFAHSQEVAVHLGVAPAIAVDLVKRRKRNHFLRITFRDAGNVHQVAVFEIPKTMPIVLMPTLVARAPMANCTPFSECGPVIRSIPRLPSQQGDARGSTATPFTTGR